MKVRNIPLEYVGSKYPESRQKNPLQTPSKIKEQRPPLEKEPSKKTGWSTSAKVCAVAATGLVTAAAIYAMTRQQEAPAYAGGTIPINPIYKEDPICEALYPSMDRQTSLKTMLGSTDDNVRRKVYEFCVNSFTDFRNYYNSASTRVGGLRSLDGFSTDPGFFCDTRKIFRDDLDGPLKRNSWPYPRGGWPRSSDNWSVLLMEDSGVLRKHLEQSSDFQQIIQSDLYSYEIAERINSLLESTLIMTSSDIRYLRVSPNSRDLFFTFCNAQIGKKNLYEAASSVAKAKIGSGDCYDRILALLLFRSLFNEGQGYEAADEAIKVHRKSADLLVRKSVLALSKMRPDFFSRIFG